MILAAWDVPPTPFTVRPAPDNKDGCRAVCRESRGASYTCGCSVALDRSVRLVHVGPLSCGVGMEPG